MHWFCAAEIMSKICIEHPEVVVHAIRASESRGRRAGMRENFRTGPYRDFGAIRYRPKALPPVQKNAHMEQGYAATLAIPAMLVFPTE